MPEVAAMAIHRQGTGVSSVACSPKAWNWLPWLMRRRRAKVFMAATSGRSRHVQRAVVGVALRTGGEERRLVRRIERGATAEALGQVRVGQEGAAEHCGIGPPVGQ